MNRALASFVAFCVALVVLFSAIAWWLGAPLVALALDPQQRQAPYHVLYLANLPAANASAGQVDYPRALNTLLAAEQATTLWRSGRVVVAAGEVADEWQQVALVRFPSGADFVRLVTGGDYRNLADQAPGGRRTVFGVSGAGPQSSAPELLLVAAQVPETALEAGSNPLPAAVDAAIAVGGRILWDQAMVVLEGSSTFNRLLLVGFEDAATVDDWLLQAATETELALLRTRVQALTVWRLEAITR